MRKMNFGTTIGVSFVRLSCSQSSQICMYSSTSDEVQLLRNPLAILAEQACEASSPISPGSAAGGAPVGERYYEASASPSPLRSLPVPVLTCLATGLYLSRPESNFALDPVTAGILNLEELDRLIRL